MRVVMYTDGSAQGNPGPGGYATLLCYKDQQKLLSAGYRLSTNNRMELMAVIKGLEALKEHGLEVHVYSDSKYLVDAVEKGWLTQWVKTNFKKKKNADLWTYYLSVAEKHRVRFHWVKGHSTVKENIYCDKMARQATLQPTERDEGYEAQARGT